MTSARAPRFTAAELARYRGAHVPDLLAEPLRLLFVGINPGLWTAAVGAHFARRGNRFYPALYAAGITDRLIDAAAGYRPDDLQHLRDRGLGITNLAPGASARAAELSREELRAGVQVLGELVERHAPTVVAVLGITAYRQAFGRPVAVIGRQPEGLVSARLWVAPNPSGLNAHASLAELARRYAEIARDAGLTLFPSPH